MTPKQLERKRAADRQYRASPKGRAASARWRATPKGVAAVKRDNEQAGPRKKRYEAKPTRQHTKAQHRQASREAQLRKEMMDHAN